MRNISTEINNQKALNPQAINSVVQLADQSVYAAPKILSNELAKSLDIKQKSMTQLIRRHKTELGVIEFEKHGNRIIYKLSPEQAYMLLCSARTNETTYRKRIATMRAITKAIRAINLEQATRQVLRLDTRKDNRNLHDLIKEYYPDSNGFIYSNFHKLLCKLTTGKTPKQYKEIHGLPDDKPVENYYSKAEQMRNAKIEQKMMLLIEMHLTYKEIKILLEQDKQRS